ncbi:MAG: RNA 2',3'-cyclic phosphodiesterase [Nitrospirota bacterium]|nr:RNA 2',3'-cyclic phosphodiesterase [Nitrospirota bacterium]
MIRTFIAVELDPTLKEAIAAVQETLRRELHGLAAGVRLQWVRVSAIHLTLKFLGDIEEVRVGDILQALEEAGRAHEPLVVDVKGFGVFPNLRAPRVLWMGLSGQTDRLIRLAESLDAALMPLGFQVEPKPYTPHLTLARVKGQAHAIGNALADSGVMRDFTSRGTLPVRAVALIKSELTPSGPVYSRLGVITLGYDKV